MTFGSDPMALPLVAPDVDLRDFQFMPLDVVRLRDSDFAARATAEEFRAGVLLWCAAWHQQPAASLPDDDVVLSALAGFGRVIKEWLAVKQGALRGWVKCGDGRLYHAFVAEKANEAWEKKQVYSWRRECDRIRKENVSREKSGNAPLPFPRKPGDLPQESKPLPEEAETFPQESLRLPQGVTKPAAGFPAEIALKGHGQGQGHKLDKSPPPSITAAREGLGDVDQAFERFWRAMPSPNPATRAKAFAAFRRLIPADQAQAVTAAECYARAYAAKPTTHPMSPARFLQDRSFEGFGPPSGTTAAHSVFVVVDTPPWHAWMRAKRKRTGSHPTTCDKASGMFGWWFPTLWAPGCDPEAAGTPTDAPPSG